MTTTGGRGFMAAEKAKKNEKPKDEKKLADDVDGEEAESAEGAPPPTKRMPGKKLVLMIGLPVALLIGGGVGAWQFGLIDSLIGPGEHQEAAAPEEAVFYDLPEMLVNLNSTGRQTSYLKLKVALELQNGEAIKTVEGALPRIIDSFQVYLRELRAEELTGSGGMYRLKEELLFRLNTAVYPTKVTDVLFKEMLVQ